MRTGLISETDLYFYLGSSHVAFENYLRIKPQLRRALRREAVLHCWTAQPFMSPERRARWVRELRAYAPLVSEDEREQFEVLPEVMTVYRGTHIHECDEDHLGLAWSLSQVVAKQFAVSQPHAIGGSYRPARPEALRRLLRGEVRKADVLLYYNGRKELEIVSDKVQVKSWDVPLGGNK